MVVRLGGARSGDVGSNLLLDGIENAAFVLLDGLWRCISPNVHLRVSVLDSTNLSGEFLLGILAGHFVWFMRLDKDSELVKPSQISICSAWCNSVAIQTHSLGSRGSIVRELLMLVENKKVLG